MNVNLFNFSKKKNSTAQPNLATATPFVVDLKEETSVMNPVLIFDPASSGMPVPFVPSYFNYVQIVQWSRYYFITDWNWLNGRWEATLVSDVLATYRTSIGLMSEYVVRSASASDGTIVDGLYPAKASGSVTVVPVGTVMDINNGCFVVGVINCMTTGNRIGAVSYYVMTENELNNFLAYLYSDNIYNNSGVSSIEPGLYKAITNPGQYIVSCMWLPVSGSIIGSSTPYSIKCGYFDTGLSAKLLTGLSVTISDMVKEIPNHPQNSRGAYMNYSPFSKYTLFYPPFGVIPIDSIVRTKGRYLNMTCMMDCITGQAVLRLSIQSSSTEVPTGQKFLFNERSAQAGVPIQLSQVNTDIVNGVSGLINAGISAFSGDVLGTASGILSSVGDMMTNRAVSIGYNGSFIETYNINTASFICEFYNQADRDVAHEGAPLMAVRTINTLSGFIKCADGHYEGSCFDAERIEINNYLTEGFYYE